MADENRIASFCFVAIAISQIQSMRWRTASQTIDMTFAKKNSNRYA